MDTEHTMNAREKIKYLIEEGAKVKCEDSKNLTERELNVLPDWYDEEKFQRGQKFFHTNIWGLMLSKFCGLIVILSSKSILDILIHTKKSSTPLTAFRRYIQTVFHMYVWYHQDFRPGSKLWNSLLDVRNKHNLASRSSCKVGISGITQKDMVITQFGFMGFATARPDLVGLTGVTDEEWDSFFHVWRVVGHLLGIEDRFNLCNGDVVETRMKCEEIIRQALVPNLKDISKPFEAMVRAMVGGLWSFNPGVEYEAFMIYIFTLCGLENKKNETESMFVPTSNTNLVLTLVEYQVSWYKKYYIFKMFLNFLQYLSFWLIENFPFLAYYQFGFKNSYVRILTQKNE